MGKRDELVNDVYERLAIATLMKIASMFVSYAKVDE